LRRPAGEKPPGRPRCLSTNWHASVGLGSSRQARPADPRRCCPSAFVRVAMLVRGVVDHRCVSDARTWVARGLLIADLPCPPSAHGGCGLRSRSNVLGLEWASSETRDDGGGGGLHDQHCSCPGALGPGDRVALRRQWTAASAAMGSATSMACAFVDVGTHPAAQWLWSRTLDCASFSVMRSVAACASSRASPWECPPPPCPGLFIAGFRPSRVARVMLRATRRPGLPGTSSFAADSVVHTVSPALRGRRGEAGPVAGHRGVCES